MQTIAHWIKIVFKAEVTFIDLYIKHIFLKTIYKASRDFKTYLSTLEIVKNLDH